MNLEAIDGPFLVRLATWFVAFLLSLTCHEAAHALAGRLGGDDTASSQVSLDPLPHIRQEPFGTLLVPILSFFFYGGAWMIGWASAPYNPAWAMRFPRKAAWMAAAGPAANFVLVGIAAIGIRIGLGAGVFDLSLGGYDQIITASTGWAQGAALFLSVLFSLNVVLGAFNLLPVPPLDGHAIVPLFLSDRGREKWFSMFAGTGAFMGLFVAWVVFGKLFAPLFGGALRLLTLGLQP